MNKEGSASERVALSRTGLLDELDRRYFAFAATLEPPLNLLALDRRLLLGEGSPGLITSLREMTELIVYVPWLFLEAFPSVAAADVFDIAEAGVLLNLSQQLHDHYIDGQLPDTVGLTLLHQCLYTAALRRFQTLFEAQSIFWTYFDAYLSQQTAALLEEMCNHWGRITSYSVETMRKVGSGKAAVIKAAPTALAVKADKEGWVSSIEIAIDTFTAAVLLADDIADWAEDYRHHRYTLPLTQAIPIEHWPVPALSLEEIGQRLEHSVILETLLVQVLTWCRQAIDAVADHPCARWVEFVEAKVADIQRYQQRFIAKKVLRLISGGTVAGREEDGVAGD